MKDGPRFVGASEVRAALPIGIAIDALRRGFLARRQQELDRVPRAVVAIPDLESSEDSELLLMPAFGSEGTGVKLASIVGENPSRGLPRIQGLYVLFSPRSLIPELLIDGAALTEVRTAAVSALATTQLARRASRHLVVFGAGIQGTAHIEAMRHVLPIDRVTIVGASAGSRRAKSLAHRLQGEGIDAFVGDAHSVSDADIVCACTTSSHPLFDDSWLRAGTHINAVGAYRLDMCELPAATLARALVVVESLSATLAEAGDVVAAIQTGALPQDGFAHEISDLLGGDVGREDDQQITIFKSVGLSVEDLVLARAIADQVG